MKFDRETFFKGYRESLGHLDQSQVNGLNFLLDKIESDPEWTSIPQIAYFLATIDHETAHTFKPIKEIREKKNSPRRANQDRYWLTGYYGRGYVQITWEKNYAKFGIAANPEKALEPDTAYMIAARGMREGLFTGKKLSDFQLDSDAAAYYEARQIVNGHDRAKEIALQAMHFEAALIPVESGRVEGEPKQQDTTASGAPSKPESLPSDPSVGVTVQKVVQSLGSKILAGGTLVTGALTSLGGAFLGVIRNPYAFAILIVGSVAIAAYIWNRSKERQLKLQLDLNAKASDPNKHTVVISPPPAKT